MYEIKPTFDRSEVQIDLPTCMYKMKTINEFGGMETAHLSSAQQLTNGPNGNVSAATSNGNDLSALQKRQTAIITQLEQLRLKLNAMQTKLGVNDIKSATANKPTVQKQQTVAIAKPIDVKNLQDIVIHVNPANIPYSLLGLKKLWTNRLNLVIECYTHSSVAELPQQNQAFVKQLNEFKMPSKSDVPSLNIALIWKQTPTTDLVCAPGTFIPITGESNILRYLMRIGPSEHGYGNSIQANLEMDATLDLTYELVMATARDHRLSILKRLSQRLHTQKAFGGDSTNVSDLVVFSTLKQLHLGGKQLPANLLTWFELHKSLIHV